MHFRNRRHQIAASQEPGWSGYHQKRTAVSLAVLFVVITGTVSYGSQPIPKGLPSSPKGLPSSQPDPYAGMTNEQRETSDRNASDASMVRVKAWLANQQFSTEELERMPKSDISGHGSLEAFSLEEAFGRADTVVRGTVKAIRFEPLTAVLTVSVEESLKGAAQPGTELTIRQAGGPWPSGKDFETVTMGVVDGSPVQLPGERAIWLLKRINGSFYSQGFTGVLRSVNGKVSAAPGNPFADDVDGQDEEAVWQKLRAASVISARTPPTTFAPPDPALPAKAEAAVFQASDFPPEWLAVRAAAGGLAIENVWANLARCLRITYALRSTGQAISETYLLPPGKQAQALIDYVRPGQGLETVRLALESPAFSGCAKEAFGAGISQAAPAGASVGAVTVEAPLGAPVKADHVFTARIAAPVNLPDFSITIVQDLVVVFSDSSIIRLLFLDAGKPFSPEFRQRLTQTVVNRSQK